MIGVFGGTFDPVHFGHLRCALELLESLALVEMRLIPCRQPPHRPQPQATAEQRLAMLELATSGQPGFVVDRRELDRPGPSYMVDTLTSLREEFPRSPLCLIIGTDALLAFDRWHRWQEIGELAHLVVIYRPGWRGQEDLGRAGRELQQWLSGRLVTDLAVLRSAPAGKVLFQSVTQLAISATDIRMRTKSGRSVRYLLPEAVREYIESSQIYRSV